MKQFKKDWQITRNWQLLFPAMGIIGIVYTASKIIGLLFTDDNVLLRASLVLFLSYLLVRLCLFIFKKLENKWKVTYRWEMIRIFIVFAITGSSSAFVGRPLIKLLGINQENFGIWLYWVLFVVISLVFYQFFLVLFGWLFGQFEFFWDFEKKMLRRFGLGFLFKE